MYSGRSGFGLRQVSIALRQRQLRVFVEGRSLCDYSDLQPVPSCARGNLSTARLGQEPCVVKSVPGITAANRNEFQQARPLHTSSPRSSGSVSPLGLDCAVS